MKPTRLLTRGLAIAALIALALAISPGIAQPGAAPVIRPLAAPIRVEATIPIQGRLTDAGGHPVPDADYTVTFYVRDGTGVICTVPPTAVHTEKGLFNAYLTGCSTSIFDGRFLTLGIQVGADPEMTPVQVIYPVPYAMSLRPGATIANNDTGHALTVKSSTSGGGNIALYGAATAVSPLMQVSVAIKTAAIKKCLTFMRIPPNQHCPVWVRSLPTQADILEHPFQPPLYPDRWIIVLRVFGQQTM